VCVFIFLFFYLYFKLLSIQLPLFFIFDNICKDQNLINIIIKDYHHHYYYYHQS
jgi:hypothetical protein